MLLLEIPIDLQYGIKNIVKYREVDSTDWYYMYMDIETLNWLVQNYGIISTRRIPTMNTSCDNPTTGQLVCLKYCGASITMRCGNNTKFYLPLLEQNY